MLSFVFLVFCAHGFLAEKVSDDEDIPWRQQATVMSFVATRTCSGLLGAPGIATRSDRTLLGAPGRTTRNKRTLLGA